MGIIVQKFGGTSVATPEARSALLNHVKKIKESGDDLVVVVSAIGRKGDPYATDSLINLLQQINPDIDPVKKDLLMSCGEIISCSLISHFLEMNGIPSEPLTGFQAGVITNHNFTNADIINIDTTIIKEYVEKGKVAVIAGFQGITKEGKITTLGRGGSDTSAVELGGYLKAERVDIFTDVQGVAIIDPRVAPYTVYLNNVSYSDMYKIAYNGAKVIHPRAVKAAEKFNIPLRVRSTFNDDFGTLISSTPTDQNKKIIGIPLDKEITYIKIKNKNDDINNFIRNKSVLYRDKVNYIEAYFQKEMIKSNKDLCKDTDYEIKDNIGKISVFFNQNYKDILKDKINDFINNPTFNILDMFWFEDNAVILTENSESGNLLQHLYSLS